MKEDDHQNGKARSCVKVEVDVLGSQSLIARTVSGRKATLNLKPSSELRSCVKVEVAVLGSPSLTLTVLMVCVDVKH